MLLLFVEFVVLPLALLLLFVVFVFNGESESGIMAFLKPPCSRMEVNFGLTIVLCGYFEENAAAATAATVVANLLLELLILVVGIAICCVLVLVELLLLLLLGVLTSLRTGNCANS